MKNHTQLLNFFNAIYYVQFPAYINPLSTFV